MLRARLYISVSELFDYRNERPTLPEPSREQTAEEIADLLPHVMRGLHRGKAPGGRQIDMTVGELKCLRAVGMLGTPSMSELSQALRLQPSTVTGLVDAIVDRDLVERYDDAEDRRVVRVRLTEEGKRLRQRHHRSRRRRLLRLLAEVDDAELEAIRRGLRAMSAAIERHTAATGEGEAKPQEEKG